MRKIITFMFMFILFFAIINKETFSQPWTEDFNTGLAGSYTTGIQTLATGDWYTVSVYPEASGASYEGAHAARINDDTPGASIRTPELNTIGIVAFYYRELNSGGGTFTLQKSYDDSNWTDITTQAFSGNTYTLFTYDVNDNASSVYIRVLSDDQSGHLLVDLFSVSAYSGGTNDNDSYVDATGVTQPSGAAIPSTNWDASSPTAVPVFQFNVVDAGSGDTYSTTVTQMTFKAGTNNTSDWLEDIGGAYLIRESTGLPLGMSSEPDVSAGQVIFYITPGQLSVADGGSEIITMHLWPDSTTTDNAIIECMIDADAHGFVADVSGSTFTTTFSADITGNQFTIDVDATQLSFTQQPINVEINTVMTPGPIIGLTDINGNVDEDYASTDITILNNGSGNMTNSNPYTTINGQVAFNDLSFDLIEYTRLYASSTPLGAVFSDHFDVTAPFVVTKLLLTEIAVTPTEGEFLEIYNPGASTIDLSDYYVTDATHAGSGNYYYNIALGTNYGGGAYTDFHARFPAGATIAAGEAQTIALTGSDNFFATYSVTCTYELYEDAGSPDGIPDMREAVAGSINGQGGFTNSGEVCILYSWDGSSDLVTDVDYYMWGDNAEGVDKTGVTINTSTYNPDTPLANQEFMSGTHSDMITWQRIDMNEGTQTTSGSNGVDGRDETSENLTVTWSELAVTPNFLPSLETPIITNVVSIPATPNSSETVDISATITDNGTITTAEVNWGTVSGTYTQTITMSNGGTGSSYTTTTQIPAFADGTTVYYVVFAEDDDTYNTTTSEYSYNVFDLPPQTLFFSEYIEGSGQNKAIEIYNPTSSAVDLQNYRVAYANNGEGWSAWHTYTSTTTIDAGDVWVLSTDEADAAILAEADEQFSYPSIVHFNGDDALALELTSDGGSTWNIVDIIGDPNNDPGSGWDVAGTTNATSDHTLVRKYPYITTGNNDWASSAGTNEDDSEWIVLDEDNFDLIGWHGSDLTSFVEDPDSQVPDQTHEGTVVVDSLHAFEIFKFKVTDAGGDGLPTKISQISWSPGPNNTLDITTEDLGGWLDFGDPDYPIEMIYDEITGDENQLFIPVNPETAIIPDGESREIIVHIWIINPIPDESVLQYMINADPHGFEANISGSQFSGTFPADIIGGSITIDNDVSINDISSEMKISPNPVRDRLFINSTVELSNITVIDITGKEMISTNAGNISDINVNNLNAGLYLIKFTDIDGNQFTQKFIKQ